MMRPVGLWVVTWLERVAATWLLLSRRWSDVAVTTTSFGKIIGGAARRSIAMGSGQAG